MEVICKACDKDLTLTAHVLGSFDAVKLAHEYVHLREWITKVRHYLLLVSDKDVRADKLYDEYKTISNCVTWR